MMKDLRRFPPLCSPFLLLPLILQGCSPNSLILESPSQDNSWVPAGYQKSDLNGDIAYKLQDSVPIFSGWGYSQRISIVARYDCESIYSEVALMDKNGDTIGWTNSGIDTPIKAGVASILTYQSNKQFASVASKELNCR